MKCQLFYLPPNQELPLPLLPENRSFQLERPEPPREDVPPVDPEDELSVEPEADPPVVPDAEPPVEAEALPEALVPLPPWVWAMMNFAPSSVIPLLLRDGMSVKVDL